MIGARLRVRRESTLVDELDLARIFSACAAKRNQRRFYLWQNIQIVYEVVSWFVFVEPEKSGGLGA